MNEPKRLRDGALGEEFRALVRSADDDVLDQESVERLRARLATAGVAASIATAAKTTTTHAAIAKLVLVAGGGVLVIAAAIAHFAAHDAKDAPPPAVAAATPIVAVPVPVEPRAPTAPVETVVSITDLPRTAAPPSVPLRPSAEPKIQAAPEVTALPANPREGLLLLRARRALPTDPALALSLVRQHESEFPESQLAPEREKIRKEAER